MIFTNGRCSAGTCLKQNSCSVAFLQQGGSKNTTTLQQERFWTAPLTTCKNITHNAILITKPCCNNIELYHTVEFGCTVLHNLQPFLRVLITSHYWRSLLSFFISPSWNPCPSTHPHVCWLWSTLWTLFGIKTQSSYFFYSVAVFFCFALFVLFYFFLEVLNNEL